MKHLSKRRRRLIIAVILLALAALWVSSRWNAWFYNPPEDPYIAPASPERVLLTFGTESNSRNISWMCDSVLYPSFVEYRLEGDSVSQRVEAAGEVFASRSGKAAYYHGELDQLADTSRYEYRVCTNGRYSEWYSFKTPLRNDHEGMVRFIFFGDIQDTLGGCASQWLKRALELAGEVDFIVCGGDLVERPTDAAWKQAFESIDSIGQRIPMLTCTGNHDYLKGLKRHLERRFSLVHSYFSKEEKYYAGLIGDNKVYWLHYKGMNLYLFDSSRGYFDLKRQREWLEEVKMTDDGYKLGWNIMVVHHPLYSVRGKSRNRMQRWVLDPIVEEGEMDLVLQGHEHAYARMSKTWTSHEGITVKRDAVGHRYYDVNKNHKVIYTISHMSPKKYKVNVGDERFDVIDTTGRCFQLIEADNSTLKMTAMNLEGKVIDSFILTKD